MPFERLQYSRNLTYALRAQIGHSRRWAIGNGTPVADEFAVVHNSLRMAFLAANK